MGYIYLITTSPGEDISNSVGVSWHCSEQGSYLIYQKVGSNEWLKIKPNEINWSIEETYTKDSYHDKRYVCNVNLKDLEPNSKYNYKIISGDITSITNTFKTSSKNSTKYSFLSFADFQYSKNQTTLSLVNTFINNNKEANLITCSGDIADEACCEESHRFLFDNNLFSNSILAIGVGDHEYWGNNISPIKMFKEPYSYNRLFNNPDNGCVGFKNTSYYFKNNTSLFIFLNCGDSNVSSTNMMFSKQAKWLDNILTKEKNYDFVIVCMHKSLYGDPDQDAVVRKFANIFTTVFDKHKVDLVISGHDHEYSRTKTLYNGIESIIGTVYLDLGNSGNKVRPTGDSIKNSNIYEKYIDVKENNYSLGAVGIIDDTKLIIEVRDLSYALVDTVTINKKH